eukprot:CAMPEP_0177782072 /NCGR_PEP_ID=MMETSP0491_2-20121128/18233_1 /TAXON_ID=63592 /ORGANISM="Tetraselmis chuii, Strain PLY429" /LENGTH=415 /DNA_ID=CAMNT_0019302269 /DNA_START=374 /DNA_END=1621 /DNA_ORIENTATION=-
MTGESKSSQLGQELPFLQDCVYLDYNATTPIFPEVAQEMQPFLYEAFGNPSSGHTYGRKCKAAVDLARQRVASAVGAASPDEIYFTSCGTESDNWAILGTIDNSTFPVPHIVTTNIEHPAILELLRSLQRQNKITFTAVGVSSEGIVNVDDVVGAIKPETCLITIMHGNNEIGALQPIKEITDRIRGMDIPFHSDAAQSLGKVKVDVQEMGVDMATFVGHKIGAPKGVAALYVKDGVKLPPALIGGAQERGMRAGTESVVLLSGFGKAAEMLEKESDELFHHLRSVRNYLRESLERALPEERLRFNGPTDESKRTANTLSVSIKGVNASLLLLELQDTVAASAGAACKRGQGALLSDTLKAIDVPAEFALGTVRLSVGRHTSKAEIDRAVGHILEACESQGIDVTGSIRQGGHRV